MSNKNEMIVWGFFNTDCTDFLTQITQMLMKEQIEGLPKERKK